MRLSGLPFLVFGVVISAATAADKLPQMPMPIDRTRSANYRWLNKETIETKLLDDMESLDTWQFKGKGQMSLTDERSIDGKHSIRLSTTTKTAEDEIPADKRLYGEVCVNRKVNGEDWRDYNRLSFWVYPDLPGWYVVNLRVRLYNEGEKKMPEWKGFYHVYHCFDLKNEKWNHVVWEIADLPRDKVTGVEFWRRRQSNEPGASDVMTFDIDHLELQKVEADHYEGWDVWPGRISFSHTGYQSGATKKAIASDLTAKEFKLISKQSGQTVLQKPVETVTSTIGQFQVMDFTEIRDNGTYVIQAGDTVTEPFSIDDNIWDETIYKAINFFYCERCGTDIPGIHRACHRDWLGLHGDKKIVINGGWHDAGDLSQGLGNTSNATYAMLTLAERLRDRDRRTVLSDRLIEEAKWGLDWILKTSFSDGYRINWSTMGLWTNGIIGDNDDITSNAVNRPYSNFITARVEALASKVLKQSDPDLAAHCLKRAVADWEFAVAKLGDPKQIHIRLSSLAILSSLELFEATGQQKYADKALELAKIVLDSQQKSFLPGLNVPLTGFFYVNASKNSLEHNQHQSHEQRPIAALAKLCKTFPQHPDWIKWYSTVVLHSEFFQKEMAKLTAPYNLLPNSIYTTEEYLRVSGNIDDYQDRFKEQVLNGFKVGDKYYVRVFPVQPLSTFRGNCGTVLGQTRAIAEAAHLRNNLELADLCQQQLHWMIGRNPFSQSLMYGEGYDYAPQYSAMSGDITGSLPVGIKARENYDLPYWPVHNFANYKEVWVIPVFNWIWLMRDLAGPALVKGNVEPGGDRTIQFHEIQTAKTTQVKPDSANGEFRVMLSAGKYKIETDGCEKNITLLAAGTYSLDLTEKHALDFTVSQKTSPDGEVTIELTAKGNGKHRFSVRADNLTLPLLDKEVTLKPGVSETIKWLGKMESKDTPWIAVIVPDNDLSQRKEAFGFKW